MLLKCLGPHYSVGVTFFYYLSICSLTLCGIQPQLGLCLSEETTISFISGASGIFPCTSLTIDQFGCYGYITSPFGL